MGAYLVRRVLLIFPTLFGIMLINFAVIQIVPGGPVEQMIAQMTGTAVESTARFSGGGEGELNSSFDASNFDDGDSKYRGAQGLDPDIIKEIEIMYGMDKPAHERFFKMLKSYIFFDFGESFFRDQKVTSLVLDKMPVSISLGLWTTLLVYLISIPLGIRKAIKDGSRFDIISSSIVTIGYAIPNFLFAVILIVFFAGGRFYDIFPLRGLVSENFEELNLLAQIKDYFWHLTLPLLAMIVSGFAGAPTAATQLHGQLEILVPMAGLIDVAAEQARLDKEIAKLEGGIKAVGGKLGNAKFVDNAPEAVVAKEREKLAEMESAVTALRTKREELAALA